MLSTRLLALSVLAALPLVPAPGPGGGDACRRAAEAARQAQRVGFEEYGRGIFFAVLEGLYEDGVSDEVVDRITELDLKSKLPVNFVYACPICMPAFDAFRTYRARPVFFGDKGQRSTFGDGLSADLTARLTGADRRELQVAVRELVERWIERHLERRRLTPDERGAWARAMEEGRKKGMAQLEQQRERGLVDSYASMKECAFCEAANGACRMP